MDEPQVGLTVLGRCGLRQPCLRLVSDQVKSWEWESLAQGAAQGEERLAPLKSSQSPRKDK